MSEIDLSELTENDWRLIKEHPLYPLIRQATADEIAAEIRRAVPDGMSNSGTAWVTGMYDAAEIARRVGGGGGGGQ